MFSPLAQGSNGHAATAHPPSVPPAPPCTSRPFSYSTGSMPTPSQYVSLDVFQKQMSHNSVPNNHQPQDLKNAPPKRGRDGDPPAAVSAPQQPLNVSTDPEAIVEGQSTSKRSRPNNYISPRVVPATFTSAMGSLVKQGAGTQKSSTRVQLRRQLSGGKLDAYLGNGDDGMDLENPDTRPRSMSF